MSGLWKEQLERYQQGGWSTVPRLKSQTLLIELRRNRRTETRSQISWSSTWSPPPAADLPARARLAVRLDGLASGKFGDSRDARWRLARTARRTGSWISRISGT